MKTLRRLSAPLMLLVLTACPPPETPGTVVFANVSDAQNDPRETAPGLGGLDPGSGLPEFGLEACRRTEERPVGTAGLERWVRTAAADPADSEDHRPRQNEHFFNDEPIGQEADDYDASGRLEGIEADYRGIGESTTFRYDAAGRLAGATVTDDWGDETTFVYSWDERGALASMVAERKLDDALPPSLWSTEYQTGDDGRLARKRLLRGTEPELEVEYLYDLEGNLVRKIYQGTRDHSATVEDVFEWRSGRLVEVSRAATGESTRYTYDDAGRIDTIERTVREADVERVVSIVRFDADCAEDTAPADQ